jgi:hypothetical protein
MIGTHNVENLLIMMAQELYAAGNAGGRSLQRTRSGPSSAFRRGIPLSHSPARLLRHSLFTLHNSLSPPPGM